MPAVFLWKCDIFMTADQIKFRTGGVIKFRIPVEIVKEGQRPGAACDRMMRNMQCGFCCVNRTGEQICTVAATIPVMKKGKRTRRWKAVGWTWICAPCKAKVLEQTKATAKMNP